MKPVLCAALASLLLAACADPGMLDDSQEPIESSTQAVTSTPLASGVPVSFSITKNAEQLFTFNVPAGAHQLSFKMTGSGDADLYVRFGQPPSTAAYDYRPYTSTSNESVAATPRAGTWFVMVRGYAFLSTVSLVAAFPDIVVVPSDPSL
jgi:hypothetical protein